MGLAGELKTIGLAEVFQNLAFNHLTGTLHVKQGSKSASIRLEEGRVRAVAIAGEDFDYVDIARRAEVAPEEVLARASNGNRRRTLKAFLHAAGNFDEARYDQAVASYVQDWILPFFGWTRGRFTFEEGRMKQRAFDREQLDCAVDLDPMAIAMEAARRHDEWDTVQEYVPSEREILIVWSYPEGDLEPDVERLLALLDGTRNYETVIKEAPLKKYDVEKSIATWVQAGHVVPATAELLREMAKQASATGDVNLAVRRLEVALELDTNDVESRREIVRLYERAGRKADAAREYGAMAKLQADRGDLAGALESYERARVLEPRNLDTLERIFQLHEQRGEKVEAMKMGRRLAEALVRQDMYEDALPLYERLLKQDDRQAGLRESFARCLLHLKEPKKAAHHLLILGDRAFDKGDFNTALKHYRSALEANPKAKKAEERIGEIESGAAQRRQKRKKQRMWVAAVACVIGLLLWQLAREWSAQAAVHANQLHSIGLLSRHNDYRARLDVLGRYAGICADHGFTRGSAQAAETVHTILVAEVDLVDKMLTRAAEARSAAQVEATLGLAGKIIAIVNGIALPDEAADYWSGARETLLQRITDLRAGTG